MQELASIPSIPNNTVPQGEALVGWTVFNPTTEATGRIIEFDDTTDELLYSIQWVDLGRIANDWDTGQPEIVTQEELFSEMELRSPNDNPIQEVESDLPTINPWVLKVAEDLEEDYGKIHISNWVDKESVPIESMKGFYIIWLLDYGDVRVRIRHKRLTKSLKAEFTTEEPFKITIGYKGRLAQEEQVFAPGQTSQAEAWIDDRVMRIVSAREEKPMNEKSYRAGPIGPYIDPEMGDQGQVTDLVPHIIDLGSSRRGDLDESFLEMFGSGIKGILNRMFGGPSVPIVVKGTRSEVNSFANVLSKEKKYMEAYSQLGLDSPATYKNKFKLDTSIRQFERKTGLIWPFK